MFSRRALALASVSLVAGCADAPAPSTGANVAIAIAPLDLPGVTNADWRLTVTNGDDDVVWTRDISADAYGDGAGSVSYVGTCDADAPATTVTIELLDLYDASSGATPIPAGDYANPGPMSRDVTCVADADVPVDFDVTVARRALQGFFDVAVSFEDVFCSAKLDCVDDDGETLELLHVPGGGRGDTVVLGFACTGGLGASTETTLYLDPVVVTCGADTATVDPSGGPGNLTTDDIIENGADLLFGAAVYRGDEQLGFHKRYWNLALGFNGGADCRLTTRGTAYDGAFDELTTSPDTVWPVIDWDVELTNGSGTRTCTTHEVDDGAGVETEYTTLGASETFAYGFGPSGPFTGVVGIKIAGSGRTFEDDTVAATCDDYLHPPAPYAYEGATGDGTYTIDPDGAGTGLAPFDVTCDMTTDGGGWIVAEHDWVGLLVPDRAAEGPTQLYQRFYYAHTNAQLLAIMGATSTHRQYYEKNCKASHITNYVGSSYERYEQADGSYVNATLALFGQAGNPNGVPCEKNDAVQRQMVLTFENSPNIPIMAIWGGDSSGAGEISTYRIGAYYAR